MLDWGQVDTVFLDMDGTLLDLRFDNHFWLEHVPMRYAEKEGLSLDDSKRILYEQMMSIRGQLKWYSIDYWSQQLGLSIIDLKQETAHLIAPRPTVTPFLQMLKQSGKRIVLFTNAHSDTLGLKLDRVNLRPYFDDIISSHELGMAKEEVGAWEAVNERHLFDRNRAVFIDDSVSVLDAANDYGIKYLFGIAQPDSTKPLTFHESYLFLESFQQLMP